MIDAEHLLARVSRLDPRDLDRWISTAWVRPVADGESFLFHEIDVARVALIRELADDMQLSEEATMPVVLSLLDQLCDARRRIHEVGQALADVVPEDLRLALLRFLMDRAPGRDDRSDPERRRPVA